MGMRQKIDERIDKKQQEILGLQKQIDMANAYVQAMQETLRMLPREEMNAGSAETMLKPGSTIAKTLSILKRSGKPMHITEILNSLGKPDNKNNRVSLAGSLGWYVRRREIFTRPSPNTFALFGADGNVEEQLPDDFGDMGEEEK